MLGELVPCAGGPPIPLRKPRLVLGREPSCDIPLRYPTVSGRHCELELLKGYWFVRDLGSSNGTHINDAACAADWLLPDDVLSVARYRYTAVYTAHTSRPPRAASASARRPAGPAPTVMDPPENRDKSVPETEREPAGSGSVLGYLVPCGGGYPIPLLKARLVVGRLPGSDIVLPLANVSGRHCELEWTGTSWIVRDLGSRNGTRVNGMRCEEQAVPSGSILSIAGLRLQLDYGAPEDAEAALFNQSLQEKPGLADEVAPEDEEEPESELPTLRPE